MIEQYIHDNVLIITPNSYKEQILLKQKKMCNIKFMTLDQFIKNVTFSYDEKTIYYLMKTYGYKYDVARMYLNQLIYIDNIDNSKIKKLTEIKQELISQNLLYENLYIKNYLKEVEIVIFGYTLNLFELKIIKKIKEITKVRIVEEKNKNKNLIAYEFPKIEDEISYVAVQIIKLLKKNIPYQNIKLVNVDEEYFDVMKRIFKFYNLDIFIPDSTLYSNIHVQKFLNKLKETRNIKEAISILNSNLSIYDTLIDICNIYMFVDKIDNFIIECIEEQLKKKYIRSETECLNLFSLNDAFTKKDYVFLMNFNQNKIPRNHQNEDYLSDSIKQLLEIDTSLSLNQLEKKKVKQKISSISNLTITYKLQTPYQQEYPSILILEMDIPVKKINSDDKYYYSTLYNKVELTKKLDQFLKLNQKDSDLSLLFHSIKDFPYLEYQNKFTGISKKDFEEYINHKLVLSYSSIDNYYRCSFRYYVNNILKLNPYEETFALLIGNLFHEILSKAFYPNFDLEMEWNNYLENKKFNYKEKFFLKKLKKDLQFVITTISEQNKLSSYDRELYEQKVYMNEDKNVSITFMGVIDKIKYKQNNDKCYVAIIDYKTGTPKTNIKNTIYGIEMQLPIYLYLASNMQILKNVEITGIYLQKIIKQKVKKDLTKTEDQQIKNQLKLEGYSINDKAILEQFDITYKDSELIKSLKISKNGFYNYSKVLSKEQIDALKKLVEIKINSAKKDILDAKFDINPKKIGKELKGCEYCPYHELCYKKCEDIIELKEYNDLSFLKE